MAESTYYSNDSILNISNLTYNSYDNTINMGQKFYYNNDLNITMNSSIYSSDSFYHVDFKVLYAWGKGLGMVTPPKVDITMLNKQYEVVGDNPLL
jgi:hypothetical protein